MIYLIIFLAALAGSLVYHRQMGVRAMRIRYIEIGGLPVDQIIDIGTKASTGVVKRMLGRPQAFQTQEGDIEWGVRSSGGLLRFSVRALPDGSGFRISGWAENVKVARSFGREDLNTTFGRAHIMTNFICRLLGIPQNARQLLRRRRRALNAIARAGSVITPATLQ
ncbi:MAG TPA: hypothetical protein VFI65_08705 [Streptosporangiaceae bacterium]|nr:hypothetical protein [Streptosporangiaceae bacterium]